MRKLLSICVMLTSFNAFSQQIEIGAGIQTNPVGLVYSSFVNDEKLFITYPYISGQISVTRFLNLNIYGGIGYNNKDTLYFTMTSYKTKGFFLEVTAALMFYDSKGVGIGIEPGYLRSFFSEDAIVPFYDPYWGRYDWHYQTTGLSKGAWTISGRFDLPVAKRLHAYISLGIMYSKDKAPSDRLHAPNVPGYGDEHVELYPRVKAGINYSFRKNKSQ